MTDITQLHQALKQYADWGFGSVLFWTNHVARLSTSHVVSLLSNIMKNVTSKILLLSFHILKKKKGTCKRGSEEFLSMMARPDQQSFKNHDF